MKIFALGAIAALVLLFGALWSDDRPAPAVAGEVTTAGEGFPCYEGVKATPVWVYRMHIAWSAGIYCGRYMMHLAMVPVIQQYNWRTLSWERSNQVPQPFFSSCHYCWNVTKHGVISPPGFLGMNCFRIRVSFHEANSTTDFVEFPKNSPDWCV